MRYNTDLEYGTMSAVEIEGSGKDAGLKFTLFLRHIIYYTGDHNSVTIYFVNGLSMTVDVSYDAFKRAIDQKDE